MEFKTLKPIFKHLFKFVVLSTIASSAMANVVLIEGHVRAMPASVPNSAAYLTLENHYSADVKLVAVTTTIAKEAQLHTIIEESGVVKMRQVSGFTVPSHGALTLQPTGEHIMLLSLTKALNEGSKVPLTLTFDNGESLDIELPVLKQSATQSDDNNQHHHHH